MSKSATVKVLNIPNEETLKVMTDTDAGKNVTKWKSLDSYFEYIEKNAKA